MELAFRTRALRNICEDADVAASEFEQEAAALLRHRLADLRAATSVSDVVAGSPRTSGAVLSIRIGNDHLLELQANHVKMPVTIDGLVDWARVTRLRVLDVKRLADS